MREGNLAGIEYQEVIMTTIFLQVNMKVGGSEDTHLRLHFKNNAFHSTQQKGNASKGGLMTLDKMQSPDFPGSNRVLLEVYLKSSLLITISAMF